MPDADRHEPLPPELVASLERLEPLRGRAWTATPLAGGITNQNFLLRVEPRAAGGGQDAAEVELFVLRVAGAGTEQLGIDRQREFKCAKAAAACGAGCEVIAFLPEQPALVVRYAAGAALAPRDLEDDGRLARAVAALRLFHEGPAVPGRFRVARVVAEYLKIAHAGGVRLPPGLASLVLHLPEMMPGERSAVLRPCHNDLLPANLIDDGERVRLIDWEYAAMGDPWFDLGNLAENNRLTRAAERRLLKLYFGAARPAEQVEAELARLRQMRFASALREAAWGFAQVTLSTLDFGFAAYGEQHWERAQELSSEGSS